MIQAVEYLPKSESYRFTVCVCKLLLQLRETTAISHHVILDVSFKVVDASDTTLK